MPRLVLTMALFLATSLACAAPGKSDEDDDSEVDGDDTGGGGEIRLESADGECGGGTCTWSAIVTGDVGSIALDIAETGDPTATCGPTSTKDLSECGFWTEYHDRFSFSRSTPDGDEWQLELELVSSFEDQRQNESTLFDASGSFADQLTILFTVYDEGDDYADCAVYGDDWTYYEAYCTNTW